MGETMAQTTTTTIAFSYTEETSSGTFDNYVFSLQDDPLINPIVKSRSDLDRNVIFRELEAGHRYWVTAQTVSGAEISTAKRLKIFTGTFFTQPLIRLGSLFVILAILIFFTITIYSTLNIAIQLDSGDKL